MEKPTVRISVRNLVEFILREGDIDSRRGAMDKEAMQKGSRLHRKIQGRQEGTYRAEVSLKWKSEYEDVIILVEGRGHAERKPASQKNTGETGRHIQGGGFAEMEK